MNKAELVKAVAARTQMSQKDAAKAIEAAMSAVKDALESHQKVQIIGFGCFEVQDRKARTGSNPATGAKINIPAKSVPVFKAGKGLKDAVAKHGQGEQNRQKIEIQKYDKPDIISTSPGC